MTERNDAEATKGGYVPPPPPEGIEPVWTKDKK